jgi:formylglycine-generating enzyme required for sulfatase activity
MQSLRSPRTSRNTLRHACGLASLAAAGLVPATGPGRAAEPAAGTVIVHPVDGARMVYVPAGPFVMGIDEADANRIAGHLGFEDAAALWAWESYPRHTVDLPGYFIDECEVTVARWRTFVAATGHVSASRETTRHFDRPESQQLAAAEVAWDEARAYARWAGKSLPTEAQWEKAARGTDGRLYPWGDDPPTVDHGHFGPQGKASAAADAVRLYAAVGSYPRGRSVFGAFDMLGNQYEWTADEHRPYPGNPQAARMAGAERMICLRGGSWYHGWIGFFAAKRFGLKPTETYYHVGFRTVWEPPAGYFDGPDFARDRRAAEGTSAVPPLPIYRAALPPVVDGDLGDACWRDAVPVRADLVHGGSGRRAEPAPLVARYAWDDRFLYIGYEVNDADLVSLASGRESGPEGARWRLPEEYRPEKGLDLAEFFVRFGADTLMWEVHHDSGNLFNTLRPEIPAPERLAKIPRPSFNDVTFHRERYVAADGPFGPARAVVLKPRAGGGPSTPNDPADDDAGYTGEIRLPWNGLEPPARIARRPDGSRAMAGETVSLLAVSLDGHGNEATYRSSAAWLPQRMFHFSAELWPKCVLVDRPGQAVSVGDDAKPRAVR